MTLPLRGLNDEMTLSVMARGAVIAMAQPCGHCVIAPSKAKH
ncbi:MAG: hypothetical protein Q4G70_10960 [Pseudomonadota bacterium]|nr:hypothetical protein [Pseudomonadota bacterium]